MYPKPYQVMNNYTKNGGLKGPRGLYEPTALSGYFKNNNKFMGLYEHNIPQHYKVIKTMSGLEVTLGPI